MHLTQHLEQCDFARQKSDPRVREDDNKLDEHRGRDSRKPTNDGSAEVLCGAACLSHDL